MSVPVRSGLRLFLVVLSISLAAAFLLSGYEFIRSPSTSLFMTAYGASFLPYAMFAGAAFTFAFIYVYGWILTWLGPRRTLFVVSVFSSAAILGSYAWIMHGSRLATLSLYAFREAYIVLLVEQYWSFINSTLTERHAKKVNGLICGGASLGAILGGYAVRYLANPGSPFFVGTEAILILAALSLLPAALFSDLAYRFGGEPVQTEEEQQEHTSLAISLFAKSSYLRRIALLIMLTQVVSTVLDLGFFTLVEQALPAKDLRTAYIGSFYGHLNLAAAILQFVAAPLLLTFVNLRVIHTAMPLIHVALAAAVLVHPSLRAAGLAFLVFKAVDYSVFRAGKEIFYIPLSFDARYRAKELIDAFGYRAAKGLSAGCVSLARMALGSLPLLVWPSVALLSGLAWLGTIRGLVHQYAELRAPRAPARRIP